MLTQYLKESTEFYNKEDNPLYYLFIIPKLVKSDPETVKQDEDLKNLINFIEENCSGLAVAKLKKEYSPIYFMNMFSTNTVKKNAVEWINEYLNAFEKLIAGEEKDFIKAYKVHKTFDLIRESDVLKTYYKNLTV